MKTLKIALILTGLTIFISGCTTSFRPWKLSDVHEGMEKSEVLNILGDPDSTMTTNGVEYLNYSYHESYNPPVKMEDNTSDDITRNFKENQIKETFKEYNYSVKIVDGKVQDYSEESK